MGEKRRRLLAGRPVGFGNPRGVKKLVEECVDDEEDLSEEGFNDETGEWEKIS